MTVFARADKRAVFTSNALFTFGPSTFRTTLLIATIAALWLRTGLPVEIWAGAGADDALFVRLAKQLLGGHWLGPFDDFTLVKGIGYPAFIALAFLAGIPLKLAENLIYLACAGVASKWVVSRSGSYAIGAILFVFFAFNPTFWSGELNRVVREYFYATLSFASVLAVLDLTVVNRRWGWSSAGRSLGTGLLLAWFWMTREEGVWLVPSLVLALFGGAFVRLSHQKDKTIKRAVVITKQVGLAFFIMLGAINGVAAINGYKYGRYENVEVKSAPFERAYGALYDIRSVERTRFMILPRDVQQRLYAVSPAAREIRPYFDGPRAEEWRRQGCKSYGPGQCSSIHTAFFQWAFREAVAAAGHYKTAAMSAAYYDRLASEIESACAQGKLDCNRSHRGLSPPFEAHFLTDAVARAPALVSTYWRDGLHVQQPTASVVIPDERTTDEALVARFGDIVGSYRPTATAATLLNSGTAKRERLILSLVDGISSVYAPIFALLALLSLPALVMLAFQGGSRDDKALIVLLLSSGLGVLSRCALICYVDVTAIPVVSAEYASPMSLLLITVAVGPSLVVGRKLLLGRFNKRADASPNLNGSVTI